MPSFVRCSRLGAMLLLAALFVGPASAQSGPNGLPAPMPYPLLPPVPYGGGIPVDRFLADPEPRSSEDWLTEGFAKHCGSVEMLGGAYFSPVGIGPRAQPRFNFSPIDLRLGCMLYSPCPDDSCLRGNLEALLQITAAPVIYGFGSIVTGPTVLMRYNFVQPCCRLAPYLQVGGGFSYNDGYRDKSQRALGQAGEFYLQATGGLHFMLNAHWAVNLEGGYLHISNAGTNERNGGINALGGSLGLTYFFGPR